MKRFYLICLLLVSLGISIPYRADGQAATDSSAIAAVSQDSISALTQWEGNLLLSIHQHRTPSWNRHWLAVSNSLALTPLPIAAEGVAGLFSEDPLQRQHLTNCGEMALGIGITMGITFSAKALIARPRPYATFKGTLECLQEVGTKSFPSGHTSFCFSLATSLSMMYQEWYVIVPSYLWASTVGFSRLYIGAHYPTDVLAGALIGTGGALLAHFITEKRRQSSLSPLPQKSIVIPIAITF